MGVELFGDQVGELPRWIEIFATRNLACLKEKSVLLRTYPADQTQSRHVLATIHKFTVNLYSGSGAPSDRLKERAALFNGGIR